MQVCAPTRLTLSVFFLTTSFILLSHPSSDLHASPPISAGAEEAKSQSAAAALSATERECQTQAVSMETSSPGCRKATHLPSHTPPSALSSDTEVAAKDTSGAAAAVGGLEDDKDRIVVEIMQMYSRQQEKLNSTLHKQLQLEMVSRWAEKRNDHRIPPDQNCVLDVDEEGALTFHSPLLLLQVSDGPASFISI